MTKQKLDFIGWLCGLKPTSEPSSAYAQSIRKHGAEPLGSRHHKAANSQASRDALCSIAGAGPERSRTSWEEGKTLADLLHECCPHKRGELHVLNVHELDQRLRQLDDAVALLTVREALDAIDKQTFHSTPDYDDRNSLVRRTGSVHSSILDGDSGATQGELCCLFVNEAALEFNKMRNALEFERRLKQQMQQMPSLTLTFESLIGHCQQGKGTVVQQFLPSMAPRSNGSASRRRAEYSSLVGAQTAGPEGLKSPAGNNTFVYMEVAVCFAYVGQDAHDPADYDSLDDSYFAPALFLRYSSAFKQSRTALAAQLKRDNIALGHMPSLVTLFAMDGAVLHQNGKSLAYMGFAQGKGGPHAGRDIDDPDHALRALFQLEQAMLDDMWHSLDKGKVWQGRVRMPEKLSLDARTPHTTTKLPPCPPTKPPAIITTRSPLSSAGGDAPAGPNPVAAALESNKSDRQSDMYNIGQCAVFASQRSSAGTDAAQLPPSASPFTALKRDLSSPRPALVNCHAKAAEFDQGAELQTLEMGSSHETAPMSKEGSARVRRASHVSFASPKDTHEEPCGSPTSRSPSTNHSNRAPGPSPGVHRTASDLQRAVLAKNNSSMSHNTAETTTTTSRNSSLERQRTKSETGHPVSTRRQRLMFEPVQHSDAPDTQLGSPLARLAAVKPGPISDPTADTSSQAFAGGVWPVSPKGERTGMLSTASTHEGILMVPVAPLVPSRAEESELARSSKASDPDTMMQVAEQTRRRMARRLSHTVLHPNVDHSPFSFTTDMSSPLSRRQSSQMVHSSGSSHSTANMRTKRAAALGIRRSVDTGCVSREHKAEQVCKAVEFAVQGDHNSDSSEHNSVLSTSSLILHDSRRGSKSFTLQRKVDRRASHALLSHTGAARDRILRMASGLKPTTSAAASESDPVYTAGPASRLSRQGSHVTSVSSLSRTVSQAHAVTPARSSSLSQIKACIEEDASSAATSSTTDNLESEKHLWFDVEASRFEDPDTGEDVILLVQTDVTSTVKAELQVQRVLVAEHQLLEQVFPRHVLEVMAFNGSAEPAKWVSSSRANSLARSHREVTILFADIVTFTNMCSELEARHVMSFLNHLFTQFDDLVDKHGVYKVETIGDCYMVAGGLLTQDADGCQTAVDEFIDPDHGRKVFAFACDMLRIASQVSLPTTGKPVQIRVGLHSGPVVSGVVGKRMPRFCLFGDTVNTASRMESTSQPGRIHVSQAAMQAIGPPQGGTWQATGGIPVKGKGVMETYLYEPAASNHDTLHGAVLQQLSGQGTTTAADALHVVREAPLKSKSAYNVMVGPSRFARAATPEGDAQAAGGDRQVSTAGSVASGRTEISLSAQQGQNSNANSNDGGSNIQASSLNSRAESPEPSASLQDVALMMSTVGTYERPRAKKADLRRLTARDTPLSPSHTPGQIAAVRQTFESRATSSTDGHGSGALLQFTTTNDAWQSNDSRGTPEMRVTTQPWELELLGKRESEGRDKETGAV